MVAHKKKIGVPKQPKPSRRARTTIADGNADFQGKINIQNGLRAIVPLSPKVAEYPALGTTFDAWSATTDKAAVVYKTIIETEATLEQLHGSLGTIWVSSASTAPRSSWRPRWRAPPQTKRRR